MPRAKIRYILPLSIGLGVVLVYISMQQLVPKQTNGNGEIIMGRSRRDVVAISNIKEMNNSTNNDDFKTVMKQIQKKANNLSSDIVGYSNDLVKAYNLNKTFAVTKSKASSDYKFRKKLKQFFNIKSNSTVLWEPLISLHAVKHMFGAQLPASFTKYKLGNFTSKFQDSVAKRHKNDPNTPINDICTTYFNETTLRKRVFPNIYGKCDKHVFSSNDVTLLIQMDTSHGYFKKLHEVTIYWKSPISVAIFINSTNLLNNSTITEKNLKRAMKSSFRKFHIQDSSVCVHAVISEEVLTFFPVNTLRNVAIKYAQTDLVFLIEADFIPMPGLDQVFNRQMLKTNLQNKKVAYVVPAFSLRYTNYTIPLNKKQLIHQWQNNITVPIHYEKTYKKGHSRTDYKKYRYSKKAYKVEFKHGYEPYYVVHRMGTPYYPEEFLHGFRDKSIHAQTLSQTGFEFHVLPHTYIVHTPHEIAYQKEYTLLECAIIAFNDFKKEYDKLTKTWQYNHGNQMLNTTL